MIPLALMLAGAGCESGKKTIHLPSRLLYVAAEGLENQGLLSEAITKYEQLVSENPGTRLASYSYLRIAEILTRTSEWDDADTNYRLFLTLNPNSFMTPYVLYRLLHVNHEKSYTGVIFREREVDRDMEPNRKIILEYKRFFLLFPGSVYKDEVTPFYRAARGTLAEREMVVGEFYFGRGQFHSAIGRYNYLLRNYPEFHQTERVLALLIEAYEENNQPEPAEEMRRIQGMRQGGGEGDEAGGANTSFNSGSPVLSPAPSPAGRQGNQLITRSP